MAQVNSRLEGDIFEGADAATESSADIAHTISPQDLPEGFDDLPIELISLIDRYVRRYHTF